MYRDINLNDFIQEINMFMPLLSKFEFVFRGLN